MLRFNFVVIARRMLIRFPPSGSSDVRSEATPPIPAKLAVVEHQAPEIFAHRMQPAIKITRHNIAITAQILTSCPREFAGAARPLFASRPPLTTSPPRGRAPPGPELPTAIIAVVVQDAVCLC